MTRTTNGAPPLAQAAISRHPSRMGLIEDGFTVVPAVLDAPMLARLRAGCAKLLSEVSPEHRAKRRSTGSLIHCASDPFFAELIAWPLAQKALDALGQGSARFSSGYLISKPPHSPPLFWHQDWWGWSDPISYSDRPLQLFLMYYLTDTRVENGCLRVLPGSHRRRHPMHDLLPAAHDDELSRVKDPDSPLYGSAAGEVAVPVKAGDLVIGDARLLHSAYANASGEERPLITLWFHPHFADQPEAIRARVAKIMRREEVDTDEDGAGAPFPESWGEPAAGSIRPLLADYQGKVAPLAWNRNPGVKFA